MNPIAFELFGLEIRWYGILISSGIIIGLVIAYYEAKRLLKFLEYFVGVDTAAVPTNSLLREFVGGGCFQQ